MWFIALASCLTGSCTCVSAGAGSITLLTTGSVTALRAVALSVSGSCSVTASRLFYGSVSTAGAAAASGSCTCGCCTAAAASAC